MRRLPVYFLIDVSESMIGEPLKAVEDGLAEIIRELRSDPYALETVYVAVLVFAGKAEVVEKLTELTVFQPPVLPIGSGTSLGAGLDALMRDMDAEVQKTTREKKGDWKPLVFLFTDGVPTDNPTRSIGRWNRDFRNKANMVAVAFGDNVNLELLGSLTENVLRLGETTAESFREFFKWVSASIQASSMAVSETGNDDAPIGRATNINLEKADTTQRGRPDDNFVILVNRCSQKGDMYLSKFVRTGGDYVGSGAWRIDGEAYLRLGGEGGSASTISADRLSGVPACPICGNEATVHCSCGKLSCLNPEAKVHHCPWCHSDGQIGGTGGFSVDRAMG